MPDPIVAPDAQPAVSSPAADLSPAEPVDQLASLSESELHTWRMDGTLPTPSPVTTPPAVSSTAPPVQDPAVSTETPPQPVGSDPAASPTPGADKRIPELLRDRAQEKDRADRAERRLADLEARHRQPSPDARPAVSSAAPAGPVKPNAQDFPYGSADPEYLEALTDYKVAATLAAERATWEQGQRQIRARAESDRVMAAFEAKAAAARAAHPDFDAVALKSETFIQPGSLADLFVLENTADEHGVGGAEVLYFLQQNPAEQQRILRLPTMDQVIALVRLGDRLKVGAPATSTRVPAPPPTLSTRATPGDPVERALSSGDYGAYKRAADAREIAARRK